MNLTWKRIVAASAVVAIAVLATGCTTKVVTSDSGASLNTVTSSGSGRVSATPDEATMSFGVTRQAADAKKALDGASTAADKISKALKAQGVPAEDIQTSGVNVYPRYSEAGGKSTIDGFEASINVTAKVKDLDKLGEIIAALSDAGADTVSGPAFGIAEDAPYRADAIKEAVEDARKQAEEMADAAGKSVGDVVSISSSSVNVPGPMYGGARAEVALDAAKVVPIETGELDVTADVVVVFELQ